MWIENAIYKEDMQSILTSACVAWEELRGRTIFVTGGTGLIGTSLINALLYADRELKLGLKVLALVRSVTRARTLFAAQLREGAPLHFVEGAVEQSPPIDGAIDYIVHGANPTASVFFVEHPVETIRIAVDGTLRMLELAREKRARGFLYLSSMEVYGAPHSEDVIPETQGTTVDTMVVRSCYPEAKRLCESLCASYAAEYGVPAKVVRLAQTFGPGVLADDNRVFAEFARCAARGQEIVLQTAGTSKRCYLYTADAVTALLAILLRGRAGEAYNAANRSTYCSIVEMARLVASDVARTRINVCIPTDGKHENKFPPPHLLNLGTEKLAALGWRPTRGLREMYQRMMEAM